MAEPSGEAQSLRQDAGGLTPPELYGAATLLEEEHAPDPMEPETYKAVCTFLGRNMVEEFPPGQFEGEFVEFSPEELMVRQDLAKNKFRWSDDFLGDRGRFLNQMHPILACFSAHRLSVISRQERIVVYVVQIFWVLLVSLTWAFAGQCGEGLCSTVGSAGVGAGHPCVFPFTHKGETHQKCTTKGHTAAWCSTKTLENGEHVLGEWGNCWCKRGDALPDCWKVSNVWQIRSVLCCMAHHTGAGWFAKTFTISHYDFGGTVYASLLNIFFAVGSFQLMICGCVQKASAVVRRGGEQAGHAIYALFTVLIVLPQPYLIIYAYEHSLLGVTMWVFLTSKIGSYGALTLLQLVGFYFIWDIQAEHAEDSGSGEEVEKHSRSCMPDLSKFHVTSSQYEAFLLSRKKLS